MEKWKNKLLYTLAGTSSGLTGLVTGSSCSGSSCPSCFKCVGVGAVIILLVFYNKLKESQAGKSCESQKQTESA
jgi:hypothetical protein